MATPAPTEIESEFARLSPDVQLTLLERLVQRTRVAVAGRGDTWEVGLAAMAADPEIQRELKRSQAKFGVTEADGLERR